MSAAGNPVPRVINVDKNPAYPAAVEALKAEGIRRRVPIDLFADRGYRSLDLLAFGFVADQSRSAPVYLLYMTVHHSEAEKDQANSASTSKSFAMERRWPQALSRCLGLSFWRVYDYAEERGMEYRWQFNKPTQLTRIDETGKLVGDYEAAQGQLYRVIAHSISHVLMPGVELALVALPVPEETFVTEQMFIVPSAALKSSQSLKAQA